MIWSKFHYFYAKAILHGVPVSWLILFRNRFQLFWLSIVIFDFAQYMKMLRSGSPLMKLQNVLWKFPISFGGETVGINYKDRNAFDFHALLVC